MYKFFAVFAICVSIVHTAYAWDLKTGDTVIITQGVWKDCHGHIFVNHHTEELEASYSIFVDWCPFHYDLRVPVDQFYEHEIASVETVKKEDCKGQGACK